MRHQSRIYIQNANSCVKNKYNFNVNMSSDICVFNQPTFTMVGADKIDTPKYVSDHDVHIIDTDPNINLTFNFTGDNNSFMNTDATFKYNIYKFNPTIGEFNINSLISSGPIGYDTFSGTSAFTNTINTNNLVIDGEYLVKGSYDFTICTEMMNNLGEVINTGTPVIGDEYGIYDQEFDYYFVALTKVIKPLFTLSPTDTTTLGTLIVSSFELTGETEVTTATLWTGDAIVSLNGLTLAEDEDYTTISNTIYLNGTTVDGDILTVAYINEGNPNGLLSENIIADGSIVSGATDEEGSEVIYFNTGTSKYEIYTLTDPIEFNDIVVTLNGITLANGVDYNQSTTNPRRIILYGTIYGSEDLEDGLADIITITYNSYATFSGVIQTPIFDVSWTLTPAPTNLNGKSTIVVAEDDTFTNIITSVDVPYIIGESTYSATVDITGYMGVTASYKVVNQKDYTLISGDLISTFKESEIIAIEINI